MAKKIFQYKEKIAALSVVLLAIILLSGVIISAESDKGSKKVKTEPQKVLVTNKQLKYSAATAEVSGPAPPKGVKGQISQTGKPEIQVSIGKSNNNLARNISLSDKGIILNNGRISLELFIDYGETQVTHATSPVFTANLQEDLPKGDYPLSVLVVERTGVSKSVTSKDVLTGELIIN